MLKEHIYLFINLEWFLKLKSGGHSPCDLNLHRLEVFKQWMLNRLFRKHETSQLSLVCCRHPTSSCIATTDNILTAAALTGNVIRRTRPTSWESILALGISPLKIRDFFFLNGFHISILQFLRELDVMYWLVVCLANMSFGVPNSCMNWCFMS